jgi:PAS domain S-box-containing protein
MKPDLSLKLSRSRRTWIPYFVLVVTLLFTSFATYYVAKTVEDKDRIRFENGVQRTQDDIQNRLDTYIAMLRAGSGLFAASDRVSLAEFRAYVDRLELQNRYPGIQGIGFSVRVMPGEKDALVADMHRQGVKNFTLQPEFNRAEFHSIVYLEPLDRRNQAAIGFDMFTEPVRREAMERARDTGAPAASGRVTLVQEIDKQKQPGFLLYVPVYRNRVRLDTVAERQAALRGFIYSPFRADDLLTGIFGTEKYPAVDFEIYDGSNLTPETLLHRSNRNRVSNGTYQPRFRATRTMDVAGRRWTISFASRPELDVASGRSLVPYISVSGLLISFVLFGVTRSQTRARDAAEQAVASLRQSEQALRESEERFQAFMNHSPAAAWITDEHGRILYLSKTYFRHFKLPTNDAVGKTVFDIYADEFATAFLENIRTVAQTNQVVETIESAPRPDGTVGDFLVYKFPISDTSGQCLVGGVAVDITERKQAEQEREQLLRREQIARAEAETANRLKDEFLATLSHELRTPLNSMLGWTQLLQTRKFDEATTTRALKTIDRNTKALSQLIEDLLDVSRIITGKLRLTMRAVELVVVIDAAIEAVRSAAEAKEIQIMTVYEPSVSLVSGDLTRLQQIFWNLVSNAIKFTPKRGQVEVRLEREGSNAQIIVSDNGQGISADFLPHMFERFRQADGTITRSQGGLGIGLSIVRHLVELHGGSIRAESPGVGQGATFIVTLPLRAIREPDNTSDTLLNGNSPGTPIANNNHVALESPLLLNGLWILVVDDEADTRDLLTTVLEVSGAKVTAVGSASAAIEIIAEGSLSRRPDILISDIGMPDGDGYSLIRQVRTLASAEGGQIPAIALTAYARAEERVQAIEAGFQIHVPKPVVPEELITLVASLVARSGIESQSSGAWQN